MKALIPALLLTPTLVLLVSLAGRRWGPVIGGRLAALPLTTGPLVLITALGGHAATARTMAEGVLTGMPTVVAFCASYRYLAARRSWWACLLIAGATTVAIAGLLSLLPWPAWSSVVVVGAATAIAMARRIPAGEYRTSGAAWDLPLRMALTTALVLALSMLSHVADPRVAGVLGAFPALVCVLAPMAHRRSGAGAAIELVHGLLAGLLPTLAFFVAVTAF